MRIEQTRWSADRGWEPHPPGGRQARAAVEPSPQLVLAFGSTPVLKRPELVAEIRQAYPEAHILGCSTAGEIFGTRVSDDTLVATAVRFEHTYLHGAQIRIHSADDSFAAGRELAEALPAEGLVHALVISEGLRINGSDLVRGLTGSLPADVTVTGGLSADGARFGETLVFFDGAPEPHSIAILGFYGERLRVGYASLGGWDPFGPIRLITRSQGQVLYELDGQSALELYKAYLGEHAADLPASALLFPLAIQTEDDADPVVRTILGIDEEDQSMSFAGDMPAGAYARLMKANFDRLIDGAVGAAENSVAAAGGPAAGAPAPDLALLISCVGRKLVLKQRVEEEVEGVREVLGEGTVLAGFYSNGEISPFTPSARCELHNQTMTITTFAEP